MSVNSVQQFLNVRDSHLRVVSGNVHADQMVLGGITVDTSHGLQSVTNTSNVTTNTVEFSNATTAFVTTANVEVGGELTVSGNATFSGTGALTVPNGTTGQRPTAANGMIRYNTTTGYMEAYAAAGWAPIAQPPTVTGISPLSTLVSGGIAQGWNTGTKIVASDAASGTDRFAYSVSMNSDGTKVIVGSPWEDIGGVGNAGAAYIFTYDSSSSVSYTHLTLPTSDLV